MAYDYQNDPLSGGNREDPNYRSCGCWTEDVDGAEVTHLCDEHAQWDKTNEELERGE